MGTPLGAQLLTGALKHDPHGGTDGFQVGHLMAAHGARIGMGQQRGLLQHKLAAVGEVFQGAAEPVLRQPRLGLRVPLLGTLAQGEQCLGTPQILTSPCHGQHLFRGHVKAVRFIRALAKGAIATKIATQPGQGNEHLGREGDNPSPSVIPHCRGHTAQGRQVVSRRLSQLV